MQWQAIGCSEKGTSHIRYNTPCQDSWEHKILSNDEVVIGAVSDGMGSAPRSDLGSRMAVNEAIKYLCQHNWLKGTFLDENQARVHFDSLLKDVVTEINNLAQKNGYPIKHLACTLLVFVATPNWLAAMQVGDGFIVIRTKNTKENTKDYQLVFPPQKGEYCNETVPITSSLARQTMQCQVIKEPVEFICAATDGIENISLIKREGWKPYQNFFEPLERKMRSEQTLQEKNKFISDFLNTAQVNQKTDDDKTVLICLQNNSSKIQNYQDDCNTHSHDPHSVKDENIATSSSKPQQEKRNIERQEMLYVINNLIKNQLFEYQKYDLEIESVINRNTLILKLLSNSSLDEKRVLRLTTNKILTIDIKSLRVQKIKIVNQNLLSKEVYWRKELNLNWINNLVIVLAIAIVITLVCLLIHRLLNGPLLVLTYFLYNLLLIFGFYQFVQLQKNQ